MIYDYDFMYNNENVRLFKKKVSEMNEVSYTKQYIIIYIYILYLDYREYRLYDVHSIIKYNIIIANNIICINRSENLYIIYKSFKTLYVFVLVYIYRIFNITFIYTMHLYRENKCML